jgi:hypothetical protein
VSRLALAAFVIATLVAGVVIGVVVQRKHGTTIDALLESVEDAHLPPIETIGPRRVMRTIVLHRHGIRLGPGQDDASRNVSSIVASAKKPLIEIPRFAGSDKAWRSFVGCVRDRFSPFDVEVVEERPAGSGYILAAVGGTPDLVGFPKRVLGLAPFNGQPIEDAVVLVFSKTLRESPAQMCETASMEIAHAYGLDHAYMCSDLMTYLPSCGEKRFRDKAASCGETKKRPCKGGAPTQNSHQLLAAELGPRAKPTAQGAP